MKLLKSLKSLFEVKVNSMVVSRISAKGNYELAATKIIGQITELNHAKNANYLAIASQTERASSIGKQAIETEAVIKQLLAEGKAVPMVQPTLVLQKRALQKALIVSVDNLKATNLAISEAIVKLGDAREEIKANLELAKVNEEFAKEGLAIPAQVGFKVEGTMIDTSTLTSQVEMFTFGGKVDSVSSLDAQAYLDSLSAK